ncbi:hypothetical protein CSKR_113307 [Clonorchis sinensis]|uniref:Uncharacterized protein n=1 Tax=Clonorchis sinensis TaxID=79923 RepID=A0A8T1LXG2_CLOSI|nr:hypothetical protein CSKR_113307 [Clonorchis sinensis]
MIRKTDSCLPVWVLSLFIIHTASVPIAYDHYDVPIFGTPRPVPPSGTTAGTTPQTTTTRTTTTTLTTTTGPQTTTTLTTTPTTTISTTTITPTTTTGISATTSTTYPPISSPEVDEEEESEDEENLETEPDEDTEQDDEAPSEPDELSRADKLEEILSAGDVDKLCGAALPFKNYEMNSRCYNKTGSCSFQNLKYQFPLPDLSSSTQWNNVTATEYVKAWLKQNNLSHYIPAICVDDILETASCDTTAIGHFYFHVHPTVNISLRRTEIMDVLPTPPKSYCMRLTAPDFHYRQSMACDYSLPLKAVGPNDKLAEILSAGDVNKQCEAALPFKNYEMNSQCYNRTGSCVFQSLKYQFPLPDPNLSTQWNNSTAAEYVKDWLKQNDLSYHIPALCVDDILETASCDTTAIGHFYFHVHPTVNISLRRMEIMDVLPMPPKSYCMRLTAAVFHSRQVTACDYPLPLKVIDLTPNEASSTSVFVGAVGVSLVVMLCDFIRTFLI